MNTHPRFFVFIAVLAAFLFSACGKSEKTSSSAVPSAAAKPPPPASGRPVEITGDDTMKFSLTEIRAKPGEALAVTLRNVGTMPKFSMGHNWVLLADGVDLNAFANDASTAAKTDYVPAAYQDRILAATKLLGPKESSTVIFTAPSKAGSYAFVCTFPGHFQVGMKGTLIVE